MVYQGGLHAGSGALSWDKEVKDKVV